MGSEARLHRINPFTKVAIKNLVRCDLNGKFYSRKEIFFVKKIVYDVKFTIFYCLEELATIIIAGKGESYLPLAATLFPLSQNKKTTLFHSKAATLVFDNVIGNYVRSYGFM